ncbi:unnamed protein product, partial [Ixodes hexagonus]
DLGPIDKNWFYNQRASQVSVCSDKTVEDALDSPSSQQSSSTCASRETPKSSRPAESLTPYASTLEWTPLSPSMSDMFKTPAVPNPRSLLHSLGVGATGPSPQWSPSLQTPPNRHSSKCGKKDIDARKDANLHLAPRSLFRSSTASFQSFSPELEDALEGRFKDVLSDIEDEATPRRKQPDSRFSDSTTQQTLQTKTAKRIPLETLTHCIQKGSRDEQELLESLNMADDEPERASPPSPAPCGTPSSAQLFDDAENDDRKAEDVSAHQKTNVTEEQQSASEQRTVNVPPRADNDIETVANSDDTSAVDVTASSQVFGSLPPTHHNSTVRRKLHCDPGGPDLCVLATDHTGPIKLESATTNVCAGSAGESLRDGSTSEESRMDLAFAKSQNDFLRVGYSFTQMMEVAESTMACLEAPDVGFTQSESSETAPSSEGILGCLLGRDKAKRHKQVAADVPASQVAFQSLTGIPVPKEISLPSAAVVKAPHKVGFDRVAVVDTKNVMPKIPTGFTTGSGKVVTVSSELLSTAQSLLSDTTGHTAAEQRLAVSAREDASYVPLEPLKSAVETLKNSTVVTDEVPQTAGYVTTGFTTAGGRSVTVTAPALAFGERLLRDVDASKNPHLQDLARVPVSANSQFETKALFRDITNRVVQNVDPTPTFPAAPSSEAGERIPTGFTTGSGTAVSVLRKSLSVARNVLSESMPGELVTDPCKDVMVTTGFTTGDGRVVAVEPSSLGTARKLLGDQKTNREGRASPEVDAFERSTAAEHSVLASRELKLGSSISGFKTAGGKPVYIQEESLNCASKLFADGRLEAHCEVTPQAVPTSLTTGYGNAVSVSVDSLEQVSALFNGAEKTDISNVTPASDLKLGSSVSGFVTAGGKPVCIQEESLKRACKLLADERLEPHCKDAARSVSTSFTTGSGRSTVTVSADSLQKVSCLFNDANKTDMSNIHSSKGLESSANPSKVAVGEGTNQIATGFKTCSGRAVTVAGDSLSTGQSLLDDVTKDATTFNGMSNEKAGATADNKVITGFMTCTGKPVSVSSGSLGAASRMLSSDTKNRSLDDTDETSNALQLQDSHGRLSVVSSVSESCLSAKQGTPLRPTNGLVAKPSPGMTLEAQRTPQSASAMFKSKLKGAARTPSFVTPFKAVGKPQTPTATKAAAAPPRSLFRKSQIQPGKLWIMRRVLKKERTSLREALEGNVPRFYSLEELTTFGVSNATASVDSVTAADFEFPALPSDGLFILGDGATVQLPPGQCKLGKYELYSAFLGVPGVDAGLISRSWFDNHYRWIVWKLASLEHRCPQVFAGRSLTPDNLMLQMKYRYDIEIDNSARSALRKILERDDIASSTLILCVSEISRANNALRVELTDGWYSLRAELDEPLCKQVSEKRIFVGQKLITSGAEIIGSADACTPLEVPNEVALKLNFNSTRRARWDAKLGYLRARQPFRVSLGSLHPKGGTVGRVDCVVIRAYPVMYLEMLSDKTAVMRSERAELVVAAKHDTLRSAFTEKLTAEVLSQVEKSDTEELSLEALSGVRISYSVKQIQGLSSGRDIWKALSCAMDGGDIERILTPDQLRLLNEYRDQLLNQKQLAIQQKLEQAFQQAEEEGKAKRKTFVKRCFLSVWRPTDELRQMLVEGRAVSIYNVNVSPVRNVLPDVQNCAVELSTSKGTRYEIVDCPEHIRIYYSRQVILMQVTTFPVLLSKNGSPGRAVDIVGLVFLASRQNETDVFYLVDAKLNFVQLVVGKQSQAVLVDDAIGPGQFVAVTDVILRPRNRELSKVAVVSTTDFSEVTCSPHKNHLCTAFVAIKEHIPVSGASQSMAGLGSHFFIENLIVKRQRKRFLHKQLQVFVPWLFLPVRNPFEMRDLNVLSLLFSLQKDPSSFVATALKSFQTPTPATPVTPRATPNTYYSYETPPNRPAWQQAAARTTPAPPKQPFVQQQSRLQTPVVPNDGLVLTGKKNVEPGSVADAKSQQIRARIALLERYTALAPVPTLVSPPSKATRKPYRKPVVAVSSANGKVAACDDRGASPESSPPMDLDTD